MKRFASFLGALLLALSFGAAAQLALTGAGKNPSGGGGGGGQATYVTSISFGAAEDPADITTGSVSPSGTNRFVFGAVMAGGFSGGQDATLMRYGGSGGTDLTQLGTDQTVGFTTNVNIWGAAGSPNSSTTMYADWAGTPQSAAMAATFYENVNQTTPTGTPVFNSGSYDTGSTGVASVTVTGCTVGRTLVAAVWSFPENNNLAAFTAVAGTTIRVQQMEALSGTFFGLTLLEGVADGSCTLSVNVNISAGGGEVFWGAYGVELLPP